MHHTAWTKKDGAPAEALFLTQAANGMMLFGAYDGLYAFDGIKFERVDNIEGNKLVSPNITSLANFDGALWVSYQFGGISVFKSGKVRHYDTAEGLPSGAVRHVDRSPKGTMWASTSRGMYWLDGELWKHVGVNEGLPDGETIGFNFPADGGIITYVGDGMFRSPAGPPQFKRVLTLLGIEGGDDRPDGTIWLYSQKSGITSYDPKTHILNKITLPGNNSGIYSYQSDARGGLWVNTGKNIELLDPNLKPVRTYSRAQGFSDDTFKNSFEDREGNLWFTTKRGVDRLRETKLTTVSLPTKYDFPLVTPGIDGQVWISGGYGAETFGISKDGTRTQTKIKDALASAREPSGAIWFGTETQLWRRKGDVEEHWDFPRELKGFRVQAMSMDTEGTLWLSILGHGAYTFKNGVWTARGGIDDLGNDTPIWIFADQIGRVWFGYTKSRIVVLEKNKLTKYSANEGLDIGNVLSIYSRSGRVWAGGETGLAYLDGQRFIRLLRHDGTSFNGVSGIVEAPDGDLWIHHVDGLKRIPAEQLQQVFQTHRPLAELDEFNHLDGLEGLPSQISPLPSLTESSDGRIWYATGASVGWIDPAHILRNPLSPFVMIRAISTDKKSYLPSANLTLPANTTALNMQFTSTSLTMPERAQFRYRLSGVDADWRDPGSSREAFYTNLQPGKYRFEVIGSNEDKVWNKTGATIEFRILPTFLQTLTFKVICVLLMLVGLYLVYLWRIRLITARLQGRNEERIDERERIARALHDTFLQSLQGLILRVDGIRNRLPDDGESREMVEKILIDAEHLVMQGRNEVMGLRTSRGIQNTLQIELAKFAAALQDQSPASFSVSTDGSAQRLLQDIQDEVLYVGREAMCNAFRHAKATTVRVLIGFGETEFTLSIHDDGVGVKHLQEASATPHKSFGIAGMRERARNMGGGLSIESGTNNGTLIRLTLPARSAYQQPNAVMGFSRFFS